MREGGDFAINRVGRDTHYVHIRSRTHRGPTLTFSLRWLITCSCAESSRKLQRSCTSRLYLACTCLRQMLTTNHRLECINLTYFHVYVPFSSGYRKYLHHPENEIMALHCPEGFDLTRAREYCGSYHRCFLCRTLKSIPFIPGTSKEN